MSTHSPHKCILFNQNAPIEQKRHTGYPYIATLERTYKTQFLMDDLREGKTQEGAYQNT
jgi:hypothetical protein